MPFTIKDVARLAGVSKTTVSRVMNNNSKVRPETKTEVLQAVEELGYTPNSIARALRIKKSEVVGVIIPRGVEYIFSDPFFPEIIKGITTVLNLHNLNLHLIMGSSERQQREIYSSLVRNRHIDGVILVCSRFDDKQYILRLRRASLPCVLIGRFPLEKVNYVSCDNKKGAYRAVEHLINLGHRRIGFISGSFDLIGGVDRFEGYKMALEKHNLEYDSELITKGDWTREGGYQAMCELFKRTKVPTAVFAANDQMAAGAVKAMREKGLQIPKDIAIVGFADTQFASYIEPPLTTIREPTYEESTMAAEMLVKLINGQEVRQPQVILPTKLVIRKSCGYNARKVAKVAIK